VTGGTDIGTLRLRSWISIPSPTLGPVSLLTKAVIWKHYFNTWVFPSNRIQTFLESAAISDRATPNGAIKTSIFTPQPLRLQPVMSTQPLNKKPEHALGQALDDFYVRPTPMRPLLAIIACSMLCIAAEPPEPKAAVSCDPVATADWLSSVFTVRDGRVLVVGKESDKYLEASVVRQADWQLTVDSSRFSSIGY
jgi:hypothetical protein